jgi:Starch-binding associating with outer membrane
MKKIFTITKALLVLSIPAWQSCSKQIDEAYSNPNAAVRQPIESLMPNIVANLAVSNTAAGSFYGTQNDGLYVGRYVQFWATNTAANQYDQMGMTTTNSTAAAADIGGSQWAMHYYGQGQNLNRVVEWGIEEKKWDYVGAAYAIRAFGWLAITDMHGEVVLKDAFNTTLLTFRYDSQEDVYEEVKRNCRLAIEYLNRTGDGVNPTNLALGANYCSMKGDVNKWKKFAYATMARVFQRTSNKLSYQPDSVIHYANLAMNDNADNAYILFENVSTATRSFLAPSRGNIGTFRQTRFSADLLSGLNTSFVGVADPRAWYILRENANGTFKGIRPGLGLPDGLVANDQPFNYWGSTGTTGADANSRYIYRDGMPWPIATATEMEFLKAEAYYLKGDKGQALTAYTNGISKNIDMLTTVYTNAIPAGKEITPAVKAAFLANPSVVPTAANLNLSHIMLQKYIALYGYGFMEVWADLRRYHYLDLEEGTARQVYTDFAPPPTLFLNNNGKLIYRVRPRYNSEYRWNVEALLPLGGLALDYHTKEQWFSQP